MKESLNDWQRLEQVRTHYNMSQETFCQCLGLNRSTYGNMIKRESTISLDVVKAVSSHWEELSPDWLLTGRGLMFRDAQRALEINQSTIGNHAVIANDAKVEPSDIHTIIDLHQRNDVLQQQLVLLMHTNRMLVDTNSRLLKALKRLNI